MIFFSPQGAAFSEKVLGLPAKEEHAYSVRLRAQTIVPTVLLIFFVAMGGSLSALTSTC